MQTIVLFLKKIPLSLVIALCASLLVGMELFHGYGQDSVVAAIIEMGMDTGRAVLISALLLVTFAALAGGLVGRSRLGAIAGAGMIFAWCYLAGFIQAVLQPAFDPGGHPEPLDGLAFSYRLVTLGSLGVLCAFLGAAVGVALAEVLLDPVFILVTTIRRALFKQHTVMFRKRENRRNPFVQGINAFLLVVLMVITATSASNLFLFAPDIGLHLAPTLVRKGTTPATQPTSGTVVTDSVGGKSFLVYLPPSYKTPQASTRRYPVLYLLHGSPGGIHDWVVAGKADESANTLIFTEEISELLLVMPDGNGRPKMTSEWGNSFDQRQRIEDYVSRTLVTYVDSHYRTLADPAHRAIGGLSMGGFGAMNIALHHPTVFGSVIALGGYYVATGAVWGKNTAYLTANSPLKSIAQDKAAWKLHIYLGDATSDQPYYTDTLQFAGVLKKLGIPYTLDLQPGHHSWNVWQRELYHALPWLAW